MKKRAWIRSFTAILLATILLTAVGIPAGTVTGASAEEDAGQVYTDSEGNRFRVIPLGDGRYELWKLVDVQKGSGGQVTIPEEECSHEHRRWGTGNDQFHWEECLDCGKLFPPEVHVFDQITVVQAASCKQNAVLQRSCICGRVEEGSSAPAEGDPAEYFAHHTWSSGYDSDQFVHWRHCTVCGERDDIHEHTISNLTVDREPTCLTYGCVSFNCSVCGGHFSVDATWWMTERYPELAKYQALGHDFSGPLKPATGPRKADKRETGTHAVSCVRCGTVDYGHKSAHSWAEYTISNGTCEDESDPVIIGGTCECGATLELRYTRHHEMVPDSSRDVQPTCTEPGKINGHRCVFCGNFGDYDFAEALGHDWAEDESLRVKPTCLEPGEKHMFCTRCDATETRELKSENPYGRHIFVVHTIREAKCGETEWYEMVCKYCGEPDGNGVVFESIKHDNSYRTKETQLDLRRLDNGTIVRPVLCETTITCSRCGKTRTEMRTIYKTIKGTAFKIVPGKDPGIRNMDDAVHPSGQFSKDPAFFESEIQRALKKDIDSGLGQYDYD